MDNKLQELTDKLYNLGIEKGKSEAEEIVGKAKLEAAEIISDAKANAENIVEQARKESSDLKQKTESELKLASKQAIAAIKNQATGLIVADLLKADIEKSLNDVAFTQSLIELMVQKWQPDDAGSIDLQVILPATQKNSFDQLIKTKISHLLANGLTVNFDNQFQSGFKIAPADNSYIINFAGADFDNFFKTYLKAKTVNLIYGDE